MSLCDTCAYNRYRCGGWPSTQEGVDCKDYSRMDEKAMKAGWNADPLSFTADMLEAQYNAGYEQACKDWSDEMGETDYCCRPAIRSACDYECRDCWWRWFKAVQDDNSCD